MIYIFLIDDHPLFINGVKSVLSTDIDLAVVGSANSCRDAVSEIKPDLVNVILLDLIMPEMTGVECAKVLKERYPNIKIIALTGELDEGLLHDAWMSGMDAILLKYCGRDELIETIKTVNKGNKIIGKNVPYFFSAEREETEDIPHLTHREEDVLKLLALGLSRREVAEKIDITVDAVNFHCKNLFRKFNINKVQALIVEARKLRIIR